MSTPAAARPNRRIERGRVTSDKRDKTITVVVEWKRRHPEYGKTVRKRTTLQVHDEKNEASEGDFVEVQSTRPLSKTKRWRLVRILEHARLTAEEARVAEDQSDAAAGRRTAPAGKEPSA
jgi:small subunit ribosomal protein S17